MTIPETTSTGLLDRAKAQDPEAWQRLTKLYSPLVYAWCRRSGVRAEDAADVLQDVFRAVHRGLAGFRHERPGDTFRGWLWTITRNKIRDHYRSRGDQPDAVGGTDAQRRMLEIPEDEPVSEEPSGSGGKSSGLFGGALELIRAEFEDRTWQAFWRATVGEERTADVAADLGMSVNAVRKAKSRVLRRLRDEFRGLVE